MEYFKRHVRFFIKFIFISIFQLLLVTPSFSQESINSSYRFSDKSLIKKGVRLIVLGKYNQALSFWEKYINSYPEDVGGYFFKAAVLQAEILEFRSDLNLVKLEIAIKRCTAKLDSQAKLLNDDNFLNLIKGNLEGIISTQKVFKKEWVAAFRHGKRAKNILKNVVQKDSSYFEAYAGIGMYTYWKSRATKSIWWLPFLSDDRNEGINYLKKALTKESLSNYLAQSQLAWIYYDMKEYEKAITLCKTALDKFPGSRKFLSPLGESYKKLEIYGEALIAFNKIRISLLKNGYNNRAVYTKYSLKTIECARKINDSKTVAKVFSSLEDVKVIKADESMSMDYWKRINKTK